MQLSLAREEQTSGLIRKKTHFVISTRLLTSEAERHTITTLGLDERLVYRPYDFRGIDYSVSIAEWADEGTIAATEDLLAAVALETEIMDSARSVKSTVEAFLEAGGETSRRAVIDL